MAIQFNAELISDLTLTILPQTIFYIKINGVVSQCVISSKIDAGASYIVKMAIESTEFLVLPSTVEANLKWDFIKVLGVEYTELTFELPPTTFYAPNIIYIKNTSDTENITISLRGNR